MSDSKVINGSNEFVPMPTPDRVVDRENVDRLDPIPFQFNDIRALAQKILKRAQEQGQAKIEAARKQVAAIEKDAFDKAYKEAFPKGEKEGYAKGEKDGLATAEKKIAESVKTELDTLRTDLEPVKAILQQIATIMNENRQALLAQAEGDLLLLALDIAKRLIGREISFDPEAIRPIATEAIGLVTDRSAVTIRVCPDDYAAMERCLPDIKALFPDAGIITLEVDTTLERGGLMAATRESEVDMRLATRLATFEEAILGFSGKDAVAPWSSSQPGRSAINQSESSYSLLPPTKPEAAAPPAEEPVQPTDQPPEAQEPEPQQEPEKEAEPEPVPEQDAVQPEIQEGDNPETLEIENINELLDQFDPAGENAPSENQETPA